MERTVILSISFAFVLGAQAQLAPGTEAPITAHLLEVNAQWAAQDAHALESTTSASFRNDAERIATHLHLVRERLMHRVPEDLSADRLANRLRLLERLSDYANARRFPLNHVLPYRNPVFIDPHGTACAVGWLMIESGHRALAEEISAAMNLAHVLDMPGTPQWPAIADWARTHGFKAEELAWIQPGYPPSVPWSVLGGGTNGTVDVLHAADGQLLVAGDFTMAGDTPAQGVALWNGSEYIAMGEGVNGITHCAIRFDGQWYLGGTYLDGVYDLARWDGSAWNYEMAFPGMSPQVRALHEHNGQLHAAGESSGFAGITHAVMFLEGGTWAQLGDPFDDLVLALTTFQGDLIAGGAFTQPVSQTDPLLLRVARFDGSDWLQIADGLDAPVHDLAVMNDTLYAGGDLYAAPEVPAFGLARIAGNGMAWDPLLPGHPSYMPPDNGMEFTARAIESLLVHDDVLYFGGEFPLFPDLMMVMGSHIGRFLGAPDQVEPMALANGAVHALAMYGELLVRGGAFQDHVAITDITTGMPAMEEAAPIAIYPNPTMDQVKVSTGSVPATNTVVRLFTPTGLAMDVPIWQQTDGFVIDARQLAAGMYLVSMEDGSMTRTARLVVTR